MNRNSKLNPMLIRAQSESAINNITSCNEELQKLKNSIQAFVDDTSIVSEAFDLLKNYASAIPGTIDKMIEHNCKDIEDYRTLATSVGDEVLIGALIIDSKNRHYKLWWESKEKADMYRSRAQNAVNYSMQSMFQGLANYYNELAQMHHQLYVYWRTKEEKYDAIEISTSSLFVDSQCICSDAMQLSEILKDKIKIGADYIRYNNLCYSIGMNKMIVVDKSQPFNDGVMIVPEPGEQIDVWYGVDEPEKDCRAKVSQYNMWSIEYSIAGCDARFPNSLASHRMHYAIDNYESNNGEEDLLIFNIDKIKEPVYAGAMIDGFAYIGDIVEVTLDNGNTFNFLILDVKNNEHVSEELAEKQVQCDWGHGSMISEGVVQLSVCEFMTAGGKFNSAAYTESGKEFLKERYVTEAHIISHVNIED